MLFGRVLAEDVQAAHHDDPSMVAWIPLRLFASLSLSLSFDNEVVASSLDDVGDPGKYTHV